jgi:hypothetical protein
MTTQLLAFCVGRIAAIFSGLHGQDTATTFGKQNMLVAGGSN